MDSKPWILPDLAAMAERRIEDPARPVCLLPGERKICWSTGLTDAVGGGAIKLQQNRSARTGQVEAIPLIRQTERWRHVRYSRVGWFGHAYLGIDDRAVCDEFSAQHREERRGLVIGVRGAVSAEEGLAGGNPVEECLDVGNSEVSGGVREEDRVDSRQARRRQSLAHLGCRATVRHVEQAAVSADLPQRRLGSRN